ncbi:MAG: hypothetical protein B9S33_18165 [Pedosphaera sp. Tous-C6FEB]|nr:MAG: hypothetical protein B9S33_18165 [Pedosphaera sp. Tous-C6FEB]
MNTKAMIKPMQTAIYRGDLKSISQFIEQGFPLNKLMFNGENRTALHLAIEVGGRHKVIKLLLAAGADPDVKTDQFKETALHEACNEGDLVVVELLLEAGAKIDLQMDYGITPVMLAAEAPKKGKEMVAALLASGASVAPNEQGRNPLHSNIKDPEIVDQLVKAGADVNGTFHGVTPLMFAVEKFFISKSAPYLGPHDKPQPKVVAALIANGAVPKAKFPRAMQYADDAKDQPIADYARRKKLPASVLQMLESGNSSRPSEKSPSVKTDKTAKRKK